jgi:hypothetical protein
MSHAPRVSVLVPAYNGEEFVGDALASLRAQHLRHRACKARAQVSLGTPFQLRLPKRAVRRDERESDLP